jgi:hypothetical protein
MWRPRGTSECADVNVLKYVTEQHSLDADTGVRRWAAMVALWLCWWWVKRGQRNGSGVPLVEVLDVLLVVDAGEIGTCKVEVVQPRTSKAMVQLLARDFQPKAQYKLGGSRYRFVITA